MDNNIRIPKFAFTSVNPTYNREIITFADVSKPAENITDLSFIQCKALWDTGATNSVITPRLVKELELQAIGVTKVKHAGGESFVNQYQISLKLPSSKIIIPDIPVSECAEQAGRFDLIIGMDIISLGDFSITGQGNMRMISFCLPSFLTIDYVKMIENIQQ